MDDVLEGEKDLPPRGRGERSTRREREIGLTGRDEGVKAAERHQDEEGTAGERRNNGTARLKKKKSDQKESRRRTSSSEISRKEESADDVKRL